jgi:hypothetical protein
MKQPVLTIFYEYTFYSKINAGFTHPKTKSFLNFDEYDRQDRLRANGKPSKFFFWCTMILRMGSIWKGERE